MRLDVGEGGLCLHAGVEEDTHYVVAVGTVEVGEGHCEFFPFGSQVEVLYCRNMPTSLGE